jgi:hypothetical protein
VGEGGIMEKQKVKEYVVKVYCSDDAADIPGMARFSIGRKKAKDIIRYAQWVKDNGLQKVETFDYSATWLGNEDTRVDCDCLNIDKDNFYYSACVKNSSITVETKMVPIVGLKKYFKL